MNGNRIWLAELYDIFFIMLLCFATLLSTMLMKGSAPPHIEYVVNFLYMFIMLGFLAIYGFYVIRESDKELRIMIGVLYDDQETENSDEFINRGDFE